MADNLGQNPIRVTADGYCGVFRENQLSPVIAQIDSLVRQFADANSITSSQEIQALNNLYVNLNKTVTDHGGSILYLNGISPTSYAASRVALVYSGGNQTATEIGTGITHSSNGVKFNGSSNGWNIGNILNSTPQDQILTVLARTNTTTVQGTSCGVQETGVEDCLLSARGPANPCAYCLPTNYSSGQDFTNSGNWIGYNNGTTYGLWHDGVYQTPDSNNAPSSGATGTDDFYLGVRNLNGTPTGYQDDRVGAFCVIDDGGTLFTQSQIEEIDQYFFDYNNTVV